MYKCNKCSKHFDRYKSLARHVSVTHNIPRDRFYVEHYLNGIWPTCKCGCGERVEWSDSKKGFCEFRHGHYSRIHNNWGNNPLALQKSLETRKERFETGEITTWNNGLTSETDERVKKNGEAVSEAFTETRKRQYSKIMRENRLDGTIPTLHGQQHSQWKGGVSEINILARNDRRLYDEWKYPILVRDKFKCVECGGTDGGLHIHHDKELMCEIVKNHMPDSDEITDFELKKSIASKIVDYHINNHVSGITLCGKCHENKHPSLNFG